MLILESDVVEHGITLNAAEARDKDEYYAMVDSGTNAIILPLHPKMEGDIARVSSPKCYCDRTHCPDLRFQWF